MPVPRVEFPYLALPEGPAIAIAMDLAESIVLQCSTCEDLCIGGNKQAAYEHKVDFHRDTWTKVTFQDYNVDIILGRSSKELMFYCPVKGCEFYDFNGDTKMRNHFADYHPVISSIEMFKELQINRKGQLMYRPGGFSLADYRDYLPLDSPYPISDPNTVVYYLRKLILDTINEATEKNNQVVEQMSFNNFKEVEDLGKFYKKVIKSMRFNLAED